MSKFGSGPTAISVADELDDLGVAGQRGLPLMSMPHEPHTPIRQE